ncbi:MAG: pilus assembly protein [Anaerolineae bacterium]|nr:pilus assembly protein [Anaerolineae bacterium]
MLFLPSEEGQGLLEYALVIVLIAMVVIVALMLTGSAIGNVWSVAIDTLLQYF